MKRVLLIAIALGCGSNPTVALAPPPPEAAPLAAYDPPLPTLRLPTHFTPTHYSATLAIDPAKPTFEGSIGIEGRLDRRSAVIWLHGKNLTVTRASAVATPKTKTAPAVLRPTDIDIAVTSHGDFLELRPAQPLYAGDWTLEISYTGKVDPESLVGAYLAKQGDDPYVVTQFESLGARLVFPCFDEPDRKTPWRLTLDVPKGQVAVSNTPVLRTEEQHGMQRIVFAETKPLPSYLVAFAVGSWEIVDAGKAKSGLPIRVITPRGTANKVAFLASAMPRIVDILEGWFGIPFPYPKLDVLACPRMGGAMENAGLITTDERIVMFDKPMMTERYLAVAVIGHETAHQWFGDLVTAAWWDDIWLNESFATWMEDKIIAGFDPSWPLEAVGLRQVFDVDELGSARKIRQPIESEGDIANSFDSITYPKGALVLRMIEHQIGPEKFQTAIRGYLAAHAYGSAKAADLFAALDRAAGTSLAPITSSFFDQPGIPEVAMTLGCKAGAATVTLAQRRFTASDDDKLADEHWAVPVCVAFEGADHARAERCTVLDQPSAALELGAGCPAWFAPAGTYGYYRAKLDTHALEVIRDTAWPKLTPDEHIAIFSDLWAQGRAGHQTIPLVMSVAAKLRAGNPLEVAIAFGDESTVGIAGGTGLPAGLDASIPTELRAEAEVRVRGSAEPIVKRFGLGGSADEPIGNQILRVDAVKAARWAKSHASDAEAKRLAAHYRDLPASSRESVLAIAANADPALAEKLRLDALAEHDPGLRDALFAVVGGLDDPKRHRAMLDVLAFDPKVTANDLANILLAGSEASLLDSEAFIRAHLDDVMKKLPADPNELFPMALRLLGAIFSTCDAAKFDERAAYATAHFSALPSAARPVKEAIETNAHCVAARRRVEPSIRAWLGKSR